MNGTRWLCAALIVGAVALVGCGKRTMRFELVPVEEKLEQQVISEGDAGAFTSDKIAVVTVSGLISNAKASGILSGGSNAVSDFRERLDAIAQDASVKAVLLRLNTPGGTVTASDMMYKDLLTFKAKTHKPVVVEMMDVCASGGYYLSCGADYRMAYPTTITGSIGVIIQTLNFHGTLDKLGISAKAITSRENKDMGSPLRPMTANDEKLLKGLVDEFYAGFLAIVKSSPQHVKDSDWDMVTDGRVFSGNEALRLGLIDQIGTLDDAIAKAKGLAGIKHAKLVMYTHKDEHLGSAYVAAPAGGTAINMINVNVAEGALAPTMHPQFLYLWTGQ